MLSIRRTGVELVRSLSGGRASRAPQEKVNILLTRAQKPLVV